MTSRRTISDLEVMREPEPPDTHWNDVSMEMPYFPSGNIHPRYPIMTSPAFRYYLYWRSAVSRGEYPQTDAGHIWLHLYELYNIDDDPEENLSIMYALRDRYAGDDRDLYDFISNVILYYRARIGRMVPDDPGLSKDMRGFRICQILSSSSYVPLTPRDLEAMYKVSARSWESVKDTAVDIFSRVLWRMGETRSIVGSGTNLLSVISGERTSSVAIRLFFESEEPMFPKYKDVYSKEFRSIVVPPVRAIVHLLIKPGSKSARDAFDALPGDVAKIVREEMERTEAFNPPKRFGGGSPYMVVKGTDYWNISAYSRPPRPKRDGCWPSHRFPLRVEEYSKTVMEPVYVAESAERCPSYSHMRVSEMQSYLRWRQDALSGNQTVLDRGYAWLMMSELLNDRTRGYHDNMVLMPVCCDILSKMGDDSGWDAMAGYCLHHDLVPVGLDMGRDSRIIGALGRGLIMKGEFSTLGVKGMGMLLGQKLKEADHRSLIPVLEVLYRDRDFRKLIAEEGIPMSDALYEGFPCRVLDWDYVIMDPGGKARKTLSNVCRVVREMEKGDFDGTVPAKFKANWVETIKTTMEAMDEDRMLRSLPEVVLNPKDVSRAEKDLYEVTALMSVEDEGDFVDPAGDVEKKPTGGNNGWDAFILRLDRTQIEYLSAALKGTRKTMSLEKQINAVSLEETGDIVVEDGRVLEEYIDEVRSRLD